MSNILSTDVIIIGGGPAGLTAGIYCLRAGKSVIIFDKYIHGGQTVNTPEIENFPTYSNISGTDFALKLIDQVTQLGATIEYGEVIPVNLNNEIKTVSVNDTIYSSKAVIIANGAKRRKLECSGEEKFTGRGVSYCATCDGAFYKDKTVAVCGSGNTAIEDALYLSNICKKVYLIIRGKIIKSDLILKKAIEQKSNIEIIYNQTIIDIDGDKSVSKIKTQNTIDHEENVYDVSGVFVAIGLLPDNQLFKKFIEVDKYGYIKADENCKTSLGGVFVAGDTRTKKLRQIVTATSDGAISAYNTNDYIDTLEIEK